MLTKGAIGNLVNRYRAVLKKCNLINTFGSLAVASMLVLGGAGVASAAEAAKLKTADFTTNQVLNRSDMTHDFDLKNYTNNMYRIVVNSGFALDHQSGKKISITSEDFENSGFIHIESKSGTAIKGSAPGIELKAKDIFVSGQSKGIYLYGPVKITAINLNINGGSGGIWTEAAKSVVDVYADNITITSANGYGLRSSYGGPIKIHDAVKVVINASTAISNIHNGIVEVTSEEAEINGNITTSNTAATKVKFEKGSFTGSIVTTSSAEDAAHLDIGSGTWHVGKGNSSLSTLKTANGTIDMANTDGNVKITNTLEGSTTVIMDAAKENKLDASNADTTGASIKAVATGDADTVSKAQASNMSDRIAGVEDKTVEVATGLVNNGFTMDGKGNIVAGGGVSSVTKAVLEAASVNTVSLDRILTNDVRKRMGDLRADKNESGVWMRWDGGKLKGNSGLTSDFNTIQIGGDTKVGKNCRLGVAGSFTHGDSEFDRGNGQLEGFSLAAYSTWMGENGMFADVVARLGNFSNEMNVEGLKGDMDNRVFSLSGEYGWRFDVCDQFFVEPQVELAYTYVSSDNFELGDAAFNFDNVNSLTGRAGLVAGWNLPNDMGNVYARASVLQQFMGDAKVTGYTAAGATVHETDGNDTWLEYGIGANVKLTDKTYIWADVERTEGATIDEEWRGTVGLRYSF